MIQSTEKHYRLSGLTPLLGTYPANEELYTSFIASKCESDDPSEGERPTRDFTDEEAKRLTVFPVDDKDRPVLLDYQLKGFFKETLADLSSQSGIKQTKAKTEKFLFIYPQRIHFKRDGNIIEEADDRYERPFRFQYMGSDVAGLKSSERILDPWEVTIRIELINNAGTPKSKPITWDAIEDALDYGMRRGILQWRNGGYGRFRWEEITEP